MGSINTVYVYKCDTCFRTVELLNDGRHPDPIRCVITNKCRGLLSFVSKRFGKPRLTPPIVGIDDRIPRGTIPDQSVKAPVIPPASLTSFHGGNGITITGLKRGTLGFYVVDSLGSPFVLETRPSSVVNPISSVITAVFYEVSPKILEYRHYMFNYKGAAFIIQGQDDTPDKNLLRFTSSNLLKIYVNGVELSSSRYNRSTDDQITLTPQINDSNIVVDVYIYKNAIVEFNEETAIRIDFSALSTTSIADLAIRNQGAWGNALKVRMPDKSIQIPLYNPSLALDVNKSYGVQRFEATSSSNVTKTLDPLSISILFGVPPFAFHDRRALRYLSGKALVDDKAIISYKANETSGDLEPTVDESYITQVFDPISVTLYLTSSLLTNPAAKETTPQKKTLVPPKKFIIGPS